ncbi:MucR family transcriptional regulator [Megalodesulfovibrio gigas]|uniref:Putative MucR family transcriptional regulator n=1 Tax=Megalodesulfovibrio gigas (strain ATCC 19364 / DSM 1382 / NCIMB 9332 / VKM B-1759) TaxID=1121448 RepID=T2G8D8_MEGG1|nr:MucR family transcriptional regulator [Megalodesulfovibrio gigas]AGW12147.1 putative MucR family transcriptional regulator [Megalodesulfovibrio gigas DSM 1382 = ATCC 19364]
MESYVKEALEIVKAQASVRNMSEEEITSMVHKLSQGIRSISEGTRVKAAAPRTSQDPMEAIKENSILCLESGKAYKILTKRHLAQFGLTPDEYRAKWGYKKGQPLVCKSLQRERRKKMKDMKLWEKRMKPVRE